MGQDREIYINDRATTETVPTRRGGKVMSYNNYRSWLERGAMATGAMATVDMLMLLTTMFSTEFTTGLCHASPKRIKSSQKKLSKLYKKKRSNKYKFAST